MIKDGKQYFFDRPENVTRLLRVFYVVCIILAALDFVIHRHVYHPWENIWLFYPVYGFAGCVLLVLVAKWMRTFLMREETYYEDHERPPADKPGDSRDA